MRGGIRDSSEETGESGKPATKRTSRTVWETEES